MNKRLLLNGTKITTGKEAMKMENVAAYRGDEEYSISAMGDAITGDAIRFERAIFRGSFRKPAFVGYELVTAIIVNDSYGREKQQHTFTLQLFDGRRVFIKGRNLYAQKLYRKVWNNEVDRETMAEEKHARGDGARADRAYRLESGF